MKSVFALLVIFTIFVFQTKEVSGMILASYGEYITFNSSFFLKLVQCQPRLNRKMQPIVVEEVRFNHT